MAVKLITTIKRFIGTAAEVAAFDVTGLPVGSPFLESDGKMKILNSAGTLVDKPAELVQLSGSNMELRGTAAYKPLATAVTVGATYWSVDTDPHGNVIEISTGAAWVVI